MKTKYRIRKSGLGMRWLEYKNFLFWHRVPRPYFDRICGRDLDEYNYQGSIISEFDWFIKEYPDIKIYLKNEYEPKQKKLEDSVNNYWKEYRNREEEVTYL